MHTLYIDNSIQSKFLNLVAKIKGLEFETKHVKDGLPLYIANSTAPILIYKELFIDNPWPVLLYLDDICKDPPMSPTDQIKKSYVRAIINKLFENSDDCYELALIDTHKKYLLGDMLTYVDAFIIAWVLNVDISKVPKSMYSYLKQLITDKHVNAALSKNEHKQYESILSDLNTDTDLSLARGESTRKTSTL